jgi:hypothetical protein
VPDTSPEPADTATSSAPLTTAMNGAVAVLSMGLAPYNLMDRALNRELISFHFSHTAKQAPVDEAAPVGTTSSDRYPAGNMDLLTR